MSSDPTSIELNFFAFVNLIALNSDKTACISMKWDLSFSRSKTLADLIGFTMNLTQVYITLLKLESHQGIGFV